MGLQRARPPCADSHAGVESCVLLFDDLCGEHLKTTGTAHHREARCRGVPESDRDQWARNVGVKGVT